MRLRKPVALSKHRDLLQIWLASMLRKHIKVEPRRYYYHCDRLGVLVWQDMISGFNQALRSQRVDEGERARHAAVAALAPVLAQLGREFDRQQIEQALPLLERMRAWLDTWQVLPTPQAA